MVQAGVRFWQGLGFRHRIGLRNWLGFMPGLLRMPCLWSSHGLGLRLGLGFAGVRVQSGRGLVYSWVRVHAGVMGSSRRQDSGRGWGSLRGLGEGRV